MDIICDHCGAVIDRITPEATMDGDIDYSFFRCPACGAPYLVAVTDAVLRADIANYRRRQRLIRMKRVTEIYIRETEKLKKQNMKRNRELMEQHPLVPFLQSIEVGKFHTTAEEEQSTVTD